MSQQNIEHFLPAQGPVKSNPAIMYFQHYHWAPK